MSAVSVSLKCHKSQKRQLEKVPLHLTEWKGQKIGIIKAFRNSKISVFDNCPQHFCNFYT